MNNLRNPRIRSAQRQGFMIYEQFWQAAFFVDRAGNRRGFDQPLRLIDGYESVLRVMRGNARIKQAEISIALSESLIEQTKQPSRDALAPMRRKRRHIRYSTDAKNLSAHAMNWQDVEHYVSYQLALIITRAKRDRVLGSATIPDARKHLGVLLKAAGPERN